MRESRRVQRLVQDALTREMSDESRRTRARTIGASARALGLQRRMQEAEWLAEGATAVVDALMPIITAPYWRATSTAVTSDSKGPARCKSVSAGIEMKASRCVATQDDVIVC